MCVRVASYPGLPVFCDIQHALPGKHIINVVNDFQPSECVETHIEGSLPAALYNRFTLVTEANKYRQVFEVA